MSQSSWLRLALLVALTLTMPQNSSVKVFRVFKILGRFHLEPMWRPALINRPPCILNEAGGMHISERNTVSFRDVFFF